MLMRGEGMTAAGWFWETEKELDAFMVWLETPDGKPKPKVVPIRPRES
jgi:hypothetical protein